MKFKELNLPNKLTVLRLWAVPLCVVAVMLPESWVPSAVSAVIALVLFIAASLTDMLDGKIARKYNMVTDFGKFMDPLADKFMVFAALITLLVASGFEDIRAFLLPATLIVILRELAVTSMRLVVAGKASATSLAANMLGKIKTVSQIVFIMTSLLEPVLFGTLIPSLSVLSEHHILTYVTMAFMTLMTVWSGLNYIIGYSKYLNMK